MPHDEGEEDEEDKYFRTLTRRKAPAQSSDDDDLLKQFEIKPSFVLIKEGKCDPNWRPSLDEEGEDEEEEESKPDGWFKFIFLEKA